MFINNEQLKEMILEVARQKYGECDFQRRPLMLAVETRLRDEGLWTEDDEPSSGSVGVKLKGLASIDWRITNLKDEGRLVNAGRNVWRC
jgi:hypothetical protein